MNNGGSSAGQILLAVNYSPQLAELVKASVVDVDLFKVPPWPDVVAEASQLRPVAVHFDFHAGAKPASRAELTAAHQWFAGTETRFLNTHLAPRKHLLPLEEDEANIAAVARQLCVTQLKLMTDFIGSHMVVVENVPYETRPDYAVHQLAAHGDFLSECLEATGARFLLDTAHARFAAIAYQQPVQQLIESYPLHRLAELHITGLGRDDQGRMRDSMPMTEDDWNLSNWVFERIAAGSIPMPWMVALEYGGVGPHFQWRSDPQILTEQIPKLAQQLRDHGLRQ